MGEVTAGIFGITDTRLGKQPILEGQELKRAVIEGGIRAQALIKKVVLGEKIRRRKVWFGEDLIRQINKQVVFYYPGIAGEYRIDDETRISGHQPVPAGELSSRMHLFGRWLENEMQTRFDHQDILEALRISAATHFGLTHILHPFNEGNGRTARVLVNGILMHGTEELHYYHIAIPPIPLIRGYADELHLLAGIKNGEDPKIDPYIKAILDVDNTRTLTPLELYLASVWSKNLSERLKNIHSKLGPFLNPADSKLIGIFQDRLSALENYIIEHIQKKREANLIPDFFEPKYVKVDHA